MKQNYFSLNNVKLLFTSLLVLAQFGYIQAQTVSDFENLILDPDTCWYGVDLSGGFTSGDAYFYNEYSTTYASNTGFAYSNMTDKTTSGYTNQFSAYTGKGYNGSDIYIVANTFGTVAVKLTGEAVNTTINGFMVTNTTYAALSMKLGDNYAKKFGGDLGNDQDWFKLTITGYLNDVAKTNTVDFYLADFRFNDNKRDYIIDTWKWVDLTKLGNVDSLTFSLSSSDVGLYGMNTPAYFAIDNFNDPLFAPAAGVAGSTAIHKDNSAFVAWATAGSIVRGPQDITSASPVEASAGDATMIIGQPGSGVASLGDGGSATLTFANPIVNGTGSDFAVFENGFTFGNGAFLELAFVEVSSDGTRFVRFPSVSHTSDTLQTGSFGSTDAKKIHNLAGKYVANYGTPFDLEDVKDSVGLDVNNITHVRIVDVIGNVHPDTASYDSYGNIINDPWPTAFASGGFDLDAVGVIHTTTSTGISTAYNDSRLDIYPNPTNRNQEINLSFNFTVQNEVKIQIFDFSGQLVKEQTANGQQINISSENMISGMYMVKLTDGTEVITKKLVIN